jgi:hypothetical protein
VRISGHEHAVYKIVSSKYIYIIQLNTFYTAGI